MSGSTEINSVDDVIRHVAELVLEHNPDRVASHLEVDLDPLFQETPKGDPHVQLNAWVQACVDSRLLDFGSSGTGRKFVLTTEGAAHAEDLRARDSELAVVQGYSRLTRLALRVDARWGAKRKLFPNLSPVVEKAIVAAVAFVLGLAVGYLSGPTP